MNPIKNIHEISFVNVSEGDLRQRVISVQVSGEELNTHFSISTHLDAFIAILVLSGDADIQINYKNHALHAGSIVLLSASHLFRFTRISKDIRCRLFFVSRLFMDEMDSTDMINRRVKYGVRLYGSPVLRLQLADMKSIGRKMEYIESAIANKAHLYYKEVVLNTVFAFYLDLSNIIDQQPNLQSESNLTRYEAIIQGFINLLSVHYRREHKVDFYASKLNLSTHHLTHILKSITGQTASDFIAEMLFSEARTLLIHSKLSVQQIAMRLNFADQSSFGKFFKRKAGMSPADFRK